MGCALSKKHRRDTNPRVFMVVNLDDQGQERTPGKIEISDTHLILYQKSKDPIRWPLRSLRRYGFEAELFSFESGRKSPMGPGIYAFKCRRAEALFNLLQECIQRAGQEERPGLPSIRPDTDHSSRPQSMVESMRTTAYEPEERHPYQNGTWNIPDSDNVYNSPDSTGQHSHEYINCKGVNGDTVDSSGVNLNLMFSGNGNAATGSVQYAEVQHLDDCHMTGTPNGCCKVSDESGDHPLYVNVPLSSTEKRRIQQPVESPLPVAGNPPCLHKLSAYERPRHYANLALGPPKSGHKTTVRLDAASAGSPSVNYAELELSNSCDSVAGGPPVIVPPPPRTSANSSPVTPRADSYATIDFQRTKAMQRLNTRTSTSNEVLAECSRKTRHNSNAEDPF